MIYFYTVLVVVTSAIVSIRSIVYTQMNGYRYILKGGILREVLLSIFFSFLLDVLSCLYMLSKTLVFVVLLSVTILYMIIMSMRKYKVHPNLTNRLKRQLYVYLAINILNMAILLLIIPYFVTICAYFITIHSYYIVVNIYVLVSLLIMMPIEKKRNNRYVDRAAMKLQEYKNMTVIGITGSFAKTTVKNILTHILSSKYKVRCSPESYNTPLGIALSIDQLSGDEDYFVVEMGAKHVGDIRELCNIVHPHYGIITGVTKQHLSTFKSIDNIINAKYALKEYIGNNGLVVFNGNDENAQIMYNYTQNDSDILTCSDNANYSDVVMSADGTKFKLSLYGESITCHTRLLGYHNLDNILMACTLAYRLGVPIQDISDSIHTLEYIPHRFEVIHSNGIIIIDDSYNANIKGIEAGLSTLSVFEGRKIVVTQGIVEAGKDEGVINNNVGKLIAKSADIIIAVGRDRRHIIAGIGETSFNMNNVFSTSNLSGAKKLFSALLRQGDVLYITNDLPDNY